LGIKLPGGTHNCVAPAGNPSWLAATPTHACNPPAGACAMASKLPAPLGGTSGDQKPPAALAESLTTLYSGEPGGTVTGCTLSNAAVAVGGNVGDPGEESAIGGRLPP